LFADYRTAVGRRVSRRDAHDNGGRHLRKLTSKIRRASA
jgi:hypothetical protein